jgi:hypothetical protein
MSCRGDWVTQSIRTRNRLNRASCRKWKNYSKEKARQLNQEPTGLIKSGPTLSAQRFYARHVAELIALYAHISEVDIGYRLQLSPGFPVSLQTHPAAQ